MKATEYLVPVLIIIYISPLYFAYLAFKRGRKGWGIGILVASLFAIGLIVGIIFVSLPSLNKIGEYISKGNNAYWFFIALIMIFVLAFVLTYLSPEETFIRAVRPVCDGKRAPEAAGFISTEDTHPTAVFILDGSNNWGKRNWTLGDGWTAKSTDEVQLVLCIGKQELLGQWCPAKYQVGAQEMLNFYYRSATVYDAKTGEKLWSGYLNAEDDCLVGKNQINSAGITAFMTDFFSKPVEP